MTKIHYCRVLTRHYIVQKEMAKIDKDLSGVSKKLNNEDFLAKAPENVVAKVKERQKNLMDKRIKLEANLEKIAGLRGN